MCPEVICTENVLGEKANSMVTVLVSSALWPSRAKMHQEWIRRSQRVEGMGSSCCSNCSLIF